MIVKKDKILALQWEKAGLVTSSYELNNGFHLHDLDQDAFLNKWGIQRHCYDEREDQQSETGEPTSMMSVIKTLH